MATFDEPSEGGGYGNRGGSGKGWMVDERGRKYRLQDGGGVREYERREERDDAVEESYRLSATVRAVLGDPPRGEILGCLMGEAVSLAELFHQETAQWFGGREEWLDRWSVQHFGRRLEPVARMVLAYEIRRRLALEDGGRIGPPAGPWKDWQEAKTFEAAAADVPPGPDSFVRVTAIANKAGREIGPYPLPMPKVELQEVY